MHHLHQRAVMSGVQAHPTKLDKALRRSLSWAKPTDSGQAPRNSGRGTRNPGFHPGYAAASLSSVRYAHETSGG